MEKPKILIFDVETKPVKAWIWRTGQKISVSHDQIVAKEKFDIICICYKWLHSPVIHSLDWGIREQNSAKMIETFSKVLESADLVVAHNGDAFDIKQINTQRLLHNQPPIMWPTSEDTLKQLRKYFAFPSYKLDYVSKLLTGTGKDRMCFQDWIDIVDAKNPKALERMLKYCRRDVSKLDKIFKQVSRYMKPKVHAGLLIGTGKLACPRCGLGRTQSRGQITLAAGTYRRRRCFDCLHTFRAEKIT